MYAGQEFPFVDELFGEQRKQKEMLSRGQRRRHCQRWVKKGNYSSTMQLKKEQEQDPDVQKWVKQENPTWIKCVEGLLCHVWHLKQTPDITYEQIVLPKLYQQQVIKIAYDISFARSSWTRQNYPKDIEKVLLANLVHRCEKILLSDLWRVSVAWRTKDEGSTDSFTGGWRAIQADCYGYLVRPLPKTSKGNRFVLVLSDYATQYPEALPMKTITAVHAAKALVEIFTCHGIPEEIDTNQSKNFTSVLLEEFNWMILLFIAIPGKTTLSTLNRFFTSSVTKSISQSKHAA